MATHLREYLRCSLFALLTHLKKKRKKNDGLWFMGPSAGSQPNPSSPFSCLTKSSSNNPQSSHNMLAASTAINHVSSAHSPVQTPMQQSSRSNEVDTKEFQSSVEKIIQEMMNSSQFSGAGGMVSADYEGDDIKDINRVTRSTQKCVHQWPLPGGQCDGNQEVRYCGWRIWEFEWSKSSFCLY
ncbi:TRANSCRIPTIONAL COREPRESSOR SEUSS-LIKE ISOFORM X1 [Salix viminalis]|uniref:TRANSCRIPTIONAL COREPRESSOR SEUSS-LIKE ISOFORM X1 n=1 Tax=Salix viminalis TaxID=40686 RepID=A0A9Q0ZK58_SALVM|nr:TRANSCRIPTIONAL COREPRESSOR SEUSS-LIKE ISOFORM X1 [Salix viminalis]